MKDDKNKKNNKPDKNDKAEKREKAKSRGRAVGKAADAAAMTAGVIIRLAVRVVMTVLLIFITTSLLFACIFAFYVKTSLSTELDITLEDFAVSLSSTIWYTNSEGQSQELVTLNSTTNRVWVDYENIPEDMEHALVAIEDKRFYKHKGVDWYRTVGAFGTMFLTMRNDFGGSTLTQQLIKNLTGKDDVTVQRKLLEIFQALELEKTYTKEEIVEWYLNIVYFGQGCSGIQTAAQTYFGKDVWDLSLAECASIVGITNNPSKYDPFGAAMITDPATGKSYSNREWNKRRQETVLYEMYDQGYITYSEYTKAVNEELNFVRAENEGYTQNIYSYYEESVINDVLEDLMEQKNITIDAARLLLYNGGYQIYCCLDMDIQNIVDEVYENVDGLPRPYAAASQQLQSAIVIMNPYTGEIVAMRGGVGEKTINFGLNRATVSQRAPGSSIKPLSVFGPALEYGFITQTTLVNDAPAGVVRLSGTSWYPHNANSGSYVGVTTVRRALALSLNTVSAQILDKISPAVSYDFLSSRLGFTSLVDADRDYAPLALGEFTNGVTVREMTQAYSAFVNDGVFIRSRTYTRVTDSNGTVILDNEPRTMRAFSSNTAANMCDMLKACVTEGIASSAYFPGMTVGGKTGTSGDNRDRYFCGITPYYVAACWTGYDIPEKMSFTGNPALEIWKRVMQPIHDGLEYRTFATPVIGQATNIFGTRDELDPTPTPTPEETAAPTPTPTPAPTPTPTVDTRPSPSESPNAASSPQASQSPEATHPVNNPSTSDDPPEPASPVPDSGFFAGNGTDDPDDTE